MRWQGNPRVHPTTWPTELDHTQTSIEQNRTLFCVCFAFDSRVRWLNEVVITEGALDKKQVVFVVILSM